MFPFLALDSADASGETGQIMWLRLFLLVGWALVYAAAGTMVFGAAGHALGFRRTRQFIPTVVAVLFLVALSQHPFPDPSALVCPVPRAEPNLVPFASLVRTMTKAWGATSGFATWGLWTGAFAAAMNLILCVFIGAALARCLARLRGALAFGLGLSLLLELTQLTGIWGLYACAYRKFDVDDLVLNTLGVCVGFWAAQLLHRGQARIET